MSSPRFLQSLRCLSRSSCQRRSVLAAYSSSRLQSNTIGTLPSRARPFSVSSFQRAALAQQIPSQPTVLLETPSAAYLEEEELDVDPIPPEKVKLVITDRAAEQLRSIATRENNPQASLRISVESGGCHGYQYKMDLAKSRQPDDYHFAHPTIQPANLVVDAVSLTLLNGSTIDYATELIGSSFRIDDNPQAKGSGCGCGVSWELKDS